MLIETPPMKWRKRSPKGKVNDSPTPPEPVAPALVMAAFDQEGFTLLLKFELPTDFAAIDGNAFTVSDALFTVASWVAVGDIDVLDDRTVQLLMVQTGPATGSGQELTVVGNNGIVPADGGPEWTGADALELPFGL